MGTRGLEGKPGKEIGVRECRNHGSHECGSYRLERELENEEDRSGIEPRGVHTFSS